MRVWLNTLDKVNRLLVAAPNAPKSTSDATKAVE
jgi:hypothetical protein